MSTKNRYGEYFCEAGLFILVLILGVVILIKPGSESVNSAQAQATLVAPITPISSPPVYPAIDVQIPSGVHAITPSKVDSVPAFTEDEVRSFVMSHPLAKGATPSEFTILGVDCSLISGDLSRMIKDISTGLPDTLPICYVELEGTFTFAGPPSQVQGESRTVTYPRGFEVFDAKTGNLLLEGGMVQK